MTDADYSRWTSKMANFLHSEDHIPVHMCWKRWELCLAKLGRMITFMLWKGDVLIN